MTLPITSFEHLSYLTPMHGAIALPQCDRLDILLANAQAGLTGFHEQEVWLTDVEGCEYPIFAAPGVDADVRDHDARLIMLLQDLIVKLAERNVPSDSRVVLSGRWSDSALTQLKTTLGLSAEPCVIAPTLNETLAKWDQACVDHNGAWLWLSAHLGCSEDVLRSKRPSLACSARSEGIYSTDVLTAVLLDHSTQPKYRVAQATEPAMEDPLQLKPEALGALTQSIDAAKKRPMIHSLPIAAVSDIERYRFRQPEQPASGASPLWPDPTDQQDLSLANTVGTVGVCALPLALLLQQEWLGTLAPLCIAHEGTERFIWSPVAS